MSLAADNTPRSRQFARGRWAQRCWPTSNRGTKRTSRDISSSPRRPDAGPRAGADRHHTRRFPSLIRCSTSSCACGAQLSNLRKLGGYGNCGSADALDRCQWEPAAIWRRSQSRRCVAADPLSLSTSEILQSNFGLAGGGNCATAQNGEHSSVTIKRDNKHEDQGFVSGGCVGRSNFVNEGECQYLAIWIHLPASSGTNLGQ